MSFNQYIPAGRTSLIKKGKQELQIQTEYAYRPRPRITTSIVVSGRVIQKIERELPKPIDSEEQQARVQRTIIQQHAEIISLIEKRKSIKESKLTPPAHASGPPVPQPAAVEPDRVVVEYQHIPDKLTSLPGVCALFRLNNDGDFVEDGTENRFRKKHKKIFKNLADLMELYGREQGGIKRQVGVYEIQPDKLYFASSGVECYFIVIDEPSLELNYEISIRDILTGL